MASVAFPEMAVPRSRTYLEPVSMRQIVTHVTWNRGNGGGFAESLRGFEQVSAELVAEAKDKVPPLPKAVYYITPNVTIHLGAYTPARRDKSNSTSPLTRPRVLPCKSASSNLSHHSPSTSSLFAI